MYASIDGDRASGADEKYITYMRGPTVAAPHGREAERAQLSWSVVTDAEFDGLPTGAPLARLEAMRGARLIIVLVFAIASACFGGKRGSGRVGTNVGDGSDMGGPWTQGSPALANMPGK